MVKLILLSDDLFPYTLQVAFQQADFAGWNLWAAINDRPLLPFRLETHTLASIFLTTQ